MGKSRKPAKKKVSHFDLEDRDECEYDYDYEFERDSVSSTSKASHVPKFAYKVDRGDCRDPELDQHLDALYERKSKRATREHAISGFIQSFENRVLDNYMENKTITLLHQLVISVKRGSIKEVSLACRAIGLLALTIGCGDNAHEIMEESIPHLSEALKCASDVTMRSSVLNCMAIITFVGSADVKETEETMRNIWELIHPKLSDKNMKKLENPLLAAAISAWSFLLSTLNDWTIHFTNWRESLSYFSNLLNKEDHSVHISCGEAIALIYEIDRFDRFCGNSEEGKDALNTRTANISEGIAHVEALKGKIVSQVRNLSTNDGGKTSSESDLKNQIDLFQRVSTFIETRDLKEVEIKVLNKHGPLKLNSWAQLIQLNFMKNFLGGGYRKHMQDNELLHDVFGFIPTSTQKLPAKEKEEKGMRLLIPPKSGTKKQKTQYLNKCRMQAQSSKRGHFLVGREENCGVW